MFRSKYRYAFIILLAAYSLVNILLVIGDKLFEFPVPTGLLFLLLLEEFDQLPVVALGYLHQVHTRGKPVAETDHFFLRLTCVL